MSCYVGAYAKGKHNTDYGLYLRFDGIAPFVFYVADSFYLTYEDQKRELDKTCGQYHQEFRKYMDNYGKLEYTIESKASVSKFIFSFIIILVIILGLFGNDTGKTKKAKIK